MKNFQIFLCYNSNGKFKYILYTEDGMNIPYLSYERVIDIPLKDRIPIIMNMFMCNDYYTQTSSILQENRYAYNNSMDIK